MLNWEARWKKDKIHVTWEILKDQGLSKGYERGKMSIFIQYHLQQHSSPQNSVPINSVVNPCTSVLADASVRTYENFLYFFNDKVATIRQLASSNLNVDLPVAPAHTAVFERVLCQFSVVQVLQHMKPTNCPLDIVTAKLLVEVFNIVGPRPLTLV